MDFAPPMLSLKIQRKNNIMSLPNAAIISKTYGFADRARKGD